MKIFVFLLLLVLLFFSNIRENFVSSDPLELNTTHIVDPASWKVLADNVLTTTIKIKALVGQIDYENIRSLPEFGYPGKSGGDWYSNINKLQGKDGWQALNEARHGHDWFFWQPTLNCKMSELEIQLIVSPQPPEFPLSFSLRIPDYNYDRSIRVWVTFTHQPSAKQICNHLIKEPLLLKYNNIGIRKDLWKLNTQNATIRLKVKIQQGHVEPMDIYGHKKDNWVNWTISLDEKTQMLQLEGKLNKAAIAPPSFPFNYVIRVKDKHMNRYVYLTLSILENPFTFSCQ